MSRQNLSVRRIERTMSNGGNEELLLKPGVNLIVGRPNTGKTKWLQTLDYLLGGDTDDNPFEGTGEEGLAEKYNTAGAELFIGEKSFWVERRWNEKGSKTKIFVDDESMSTRDFQKRLAQELNIPSLNFPKGNPMSGQTWPELSFRMLLRQIYRRQPFWGDIADKQPEGEQHACLLQFLGLAKNLFTEEYGQLVKLKMEVERLKARRDQHSQTLSELARELLSEPEISVEVNASTVRNAGDRLLYEMDSLIEQRTALIKGAQDKTVPHDNQRSTEKRGEERAEVLINLEKLKHRAKANMERLEEINRYSSELAEELDRINRAEVAGSVLANLRITHCPACDQTVNKTLSNAEQCFLCDQDLPDEPLLDGLGPLRLKFESDRINGEYKEAAELIGALHKDAKLLLSEIVKTEERLRTLNNELAPARIAVSALIQDDISQIDMSLGELNERQRHLGRVSVALNLTQDITKDIAEKERDIEPLQSLVDEAIRSTDFEAASSLLEDGMNAYLSAINVLRPGVWRHSPIRIDLFRSRYTIRVGARRWRAALGGTDSLYFLMAFNYGLLSLSSLPGCHYPGLSIIDLPGEFSGEAVEDKENFIIQPFIDLLKKPENNGVQVIITGVSFVGLEGVHRQKLTHVHAS